MKASKGRAASIRVAATGVALALTLGVTLVLAAGCGVLGGESGKGEKAPRTRRTPSGAAALERVAYVKDGDIYTAQLDGGGEERLTERGDIIDFAVSASGDKLAFIAERRTGERDWGGEVVPEYGYDLFLMDQNGLNIVHAAAAGAALRINPNMAPAFDPEGKCFYFSGMSNQDFERGGDYTLVFARYDIESGKVETVHTRPMEGFQYADGLIVDPDGTKLYFNYNGSQWPGTEVVSVDLGNGTETQLISDESEMGLYKLVSISADRQNVAYVKATGDSPDFVNRMYIRPFSGGEEKAVGEGSGSPGPDDYNLEFSGLDPEVYYMTVCSYPEGLYNEDEAGIRFLRGTVGGADPVPTGLVVTGKTTSASGSTSGGIKNWRLLRK